MVNLTKNSVVSKALKEKGVVVLPLDKYEKMREKIEKLENEKRLAAEEVETLRIIAEGEKEYKEGRLKSIKSLADLR